MGKLGAGDRAPEFSLPGVGPAGDGTFALHDYAGRPVVLAFYPADNSPVCTVQLTSYSNDVSTFGEFGAQVLAVSPQSLDSHRDFAARKRLAFPLLSDSDKKVGEAYGVLGPLGFYRRSIFVIDREGIIRYAHRSITSLGYESTDTIAAALRDLV